MSETNNQQTDNADRGAAGELREVPKDITEYKKFVAEGGHEHNEKILGREAAVAAAKAAGIVPESEPGEKQAQGTKRPRHNLRWYTAKLERRIGERDARIADLEKRIATPAPNGAAAPSNGTAPAKAVERVTEPDVNQGAKPAGGADKKAPPRPVEKDFKTYGEFIEALTEWKTDRKLEEAEAKRRETARTADAETKNKAITDAHNARVDEAKTRYSAWDKAFKGLDDNSFTDPMVVFIFESERGPDVTYYLATHRDELERIKALSPLRQAAALGKIEDQFTSDDDDAEGKEEKDDEEETETYEDAAARKKATEKKSEPPEPKPQTKRVSSAPPPAKPLGGRGGKDDPMPDPRDFSAYEAWSKRQTARGVKR